jgi:hypothetical protein
MRLIASPRRSCATLDALSAARRPAEELGTRQVGHGADVLVAAARQVDQQVLVGRIVAASFIA